MNIFRNILPGFLALSVCLTSPVWAQESAQVSVVVSEKPAETDTVMVALMQTSLASGKITSPQADYVVFVSTMNWSPPTEAEMDALAKAYAEMTAEKKVELVLVCGGASEDSARDFAAKHKLESPTVLSDVAPSIPGYVTPFVYPNVTIVDKYGKLVQTGGIDLAPKYKAYISKYEMEADLEPTFSVSKTELEEEKKAAEKKSSCCKASKSLAEAVGRLKVFNKNKASGDAQYYIFYFGASTCCNCVARLADAAAFYAEMEADGRVEMIYVSYDKSKSVAKRFFAKENAGFPAVMNDDKRLQKLPGYSPMYSFPTVQILESSGREIIRGRAKNILPRWKELTVDQL